MMWAALQGLRPQGCMLVRDCIDQLTGHGSHPALAHLWHVTQLPPNIYHADAHIARRGHQPVGQAASNERSSPMLGTHQARKELTVEPQSRPLGQALRRR